MTERSNSFSGSVKLPAELIPISDIDAELSKAREDETDFCSTDFSKLVCDSTDFSSLYFKNCLFKGSRFTACDFQNPHSLTVFSKAVIYQTVISPRAISEPAPLPHARLSERLSRAHIIKMSALTAAALSCRTFSVQSFNRCV